MNTYKITNITSQLGKRQANYNSTLKVSYIDGMERKNLFIKPDEEVYFTTVSLPISLHKFRVKGLVSISDVTDKELRNVKNEDASKKPKVIKKTKTSAKKKATTEKKRTYTKKKPATAGKKMTEN